MVTLAKLLQFSNAPNPIEVTLSGIVTLFSEVQLEKAISPIEVTLLPIVTFVRPVQYQNRFLSIEVTPLPIVALVRLVQLTNTSFSIDVTLSGIFILFNEAQLKNAKALICVMSKGINKSVTFSLLRYSWSASCNGFAVELLKVILHHDFKLEMETLARERHLAKASFPIEITLSGMVTLVKLLQL